MDERKSKAAIAFLPYAARREENGTGELSNAFFRVVTFSLISHCIFEPVTQCLKAVLPLSFKYATLDAFRCGWKYLWYASDAGPTMQLWIRAASALPYTDNVGGSVVGTLLSIVSSDELSHTYLWLLGTG
jgi:hypothetical protein